MKEQIEQMLTELEKAVKECNERSTKAEANKDKWLYEGAEIAYTNVISSVRREFKNLLQPDVSGSLPLEEQLAKEIGEMSDEEFAENCRKLKGNDR